MDRNVDWDISSELGHYNLYIDGKFYCSADTYEEAYKEYLEYESSRDEQAP